MAVAAAAGGGIAAYLKSRDDAVAADGDKGKVKRKKKQPKYKDPDANYQPKPLSELRGKYRIIDAHEHMKNRAVAPRMLHVMDDLGIEKTVICAGSMTTTHKGSAPFVGWEENNDEMIEIAKLYPDRFVPFVTLRPGLPDAVEQLKKWVAKGAKGLKLYTGHSKFYKLRVSETETVEYKLDDPSMMPVFAYLEKTQLPLLWHVTPAAYPAEFKHVMETYPKLRVNCPHHCMSLGNLDLVRELFRKYPNFYTDTSHGYHEYMAGALRSIAKRGENFKKLYLEFPDRFLWGTDVVITDKRQKTAEWIKIMAQTYFDMFEKDRFKLPVYNKDYALDREEDLPGLQLPEEFLRKMYETNPRRWLKLDKKSGK